MSAAGQEQEWLHELLRKVYNYGVSTREQGLYEPHEKLGVDEAKVAITSRIKQMEVEARCVELDELVEHHEPGMVGVEWRAIYKWRDERKKQLQSHRPNVEENTKCT